MQRARIVQLTDLHLTARAGARVFGSDVWANLDRTLAHVAAMPDVDRLVLTGDVANSGSADAYSRLAEWLRPWRGRLCIVPGNHDHRERLRAAFPELWAPHAQRLSFAVDANDANDANGAGAGAVALIGLDSLVAGRTRGELGKAQLEWLQAHVAPRRAPWLLFLHHPPVRVRCWWLDKDLLRDRDELAAVLAASPPRAIFTGHVHQQHVAAFAGTTVTTAPAVAYQYRPRSWLPLPRSRAPALRAIDVSDGVVTSRMETP
jgi:3',5'-cyclic-AMP phosphodiesterase